MKKFNMSAFVVLEKNRWDISYNLSVNFSIIKNDEWTGDVVNTKCGEVFHKNMGIQGWMGEQYDKVLGANEISYLGVYAANQYDIERMCKSLKRINNKLNTIGEKYGHANTFDQFFLRLCSVLGVTEVAFNNTVWDSLGNQYADRGANLSVEDACMWLRSLEGKLCKGKEKNEEQVA